MELEFCPTLENLYRTREAGGRSGKPFRLTGGLSTVNNLLTIRQLMVEIDPERTLEVGMACGGSALTFAATHRDLQHKPCRQHVAIDGFQCSGYDDVGRLKLEEAGLSDYVEVREQLSALALPQMVQEGLKFQLVYIDGSHRFEDVFCDFYFVRYLMAVGGYVLFDDSSDPEVAKVVRFVRKNLRECFEPVPISRYRGQTTAQRLQYAIAEALYKTQLAIFRKIKEGERAGGHTLRTF
jgi:methyltransferase family protein